MLRSVMSNHFDLGFERACAAKILQDRDHVPRRGSDCRHSSYKILDRSALFENHIACLFLFGAYGSLREYLSCGALARECTGLRNRIRGLDFDTQIAVQNRHWSDTHVLAEHDRAGT